MRERIVIALDVRRTAEALADATGLPWETVLDHLPAYVAGYAEDVLPDMLRRDEGTQLDFVSYVMSEQRQTAPPTGAV